MLTIFKRITELVTLAGYFREPMRHPEEKYLGRVGNAFLVAQDGKILAIGNMSAYQESWEQVAGQEVEVVDLGSRGPRVVLPGFVDPHTHALFAGWRGDEFLQRLEGVGYREILARGGGILRTVQAVRRAGEEELATGLHRVLDRLLANGTTTVEIKSGYGLDTENELKMLRVIDRVNREHAIDIVPTFMGAHAVPPEYKGKTDAFVELVVGEMLPAVVEQGLARFCDVFCEEGVFSVEQSRRILERALDLGLDIKLHADELSPLGGAELAGELGARSADHLVHVSEEGIDALARSGVVAVGLPGTSVFLQSGHYLPGRKLVEAGVPMALATDFNPGSSTFTDQKLMAAFGCLHLGLSPAEALVGVTINAAHAVGLGEQVGSLQAGKQADLVVLAADSYVDLTYQPGGDLLEEVYKGGRLVWQRAAGYSKSGTHGTPNS